MNNHPGYPPPGFPPYGRQHRISPDLPTNYHGLQRSPHCDTQEFPRNERVTPYSNSFRKETSLGFNDSSSLEARQKFSSEDLNSYRHGSRPFRLSRDDIFSGGKIDRRTLLQSAPRSSILNESLSHTYSSMNKVDSKSYSFSNLNQSQVTSMFKSDLYSNISRNTGLKEDTLYSDILPSGPISNVQKFDRNLPFPNERMYPESSSHLNKISSTCGYSKNASFTNTRTFSGEHTPDANFVHKNIPSGASYSINHNFEHQDLDKQVEEIQRVLEEQRRLRAEEVRNSLSSNTPPLSLPRDMKSVSLKNLQSTLNSFSNQLTPKQADWYMNTLDTIQSETDNKVPRCDVQPSNNAFHKEVSNYSQPSIHQPLEILHGDVLNIKESEHWKNVGFQNTSGAPEKMVVEENSGHKLSLEFTGETIATTMGSSISGTMSQFPAISANNAEQIDGKAANFEKPRTTEIIFQNSQDLNNKNLVASVSLPETSNVENTIPLHAKPINSNNSDTHLVSSSVPFENLPSKGWTNFKSSEGILNKSIESKNYLANVSISVPINEINNSNSVCSGNNLNENHKASKEPSVIVNENASTEWPTVSLEDNLTKCLEIMKNYSPLLIKNSELKSEDLPVDSNSNERLEISDKLSKNSVENISQNSAENIPSNELSNAAPIPFLNEASDPGSLSNDSVKPALDLSQEPESSSLPSFNSVIASSNEVSTNKSVLEDALLTLDIKSPVVGLDYIVEDKKSLSVEGRFPFKCKLCNSSIARTLILDHVQGSKHRLRYLKTKDEAIYNRIMHQKDQYTDKDTLICEAAAEMEQKYGRGKVIVLLNSPLKVMKHVPIAISKVSHDLIDVDFESIHKPDVKNTETKITVENKPEEKVISTSLEPVIKAEEDLSNSSVISSTTNLSVDNIEKSTLKDISEIKVEKASNAIEISEDTQIDKQPDAKCEASLCAQRQINKPVGSPLVERNSIDNTGLKRSASFGDEMYMKAKRLDVKKLNMDWNVSADFHTSSSYDPSSNKEVAESKIFNPLLLEKLSKCDISSEDEAGIVLQTIDVLLKLLLEYRLKGNRNFDVENLMRSLHNKSSEEFSKILGSLEGNLMASNTCKEEIPTVLSKHGSNIQFNIPEKQQNNLASDNPTRESNNKLAVSLESGLTAPVISTNLPSKSQLLQPPPFFCWPTSSQAETTLGQSSVTASQTVQNNMTWSSAYQSSVAYYQQQGFSVPHMYQPYGIPLVPSVPAAPVPLVAQVPSVVSPTIIPPLPPSSVNISAPLPPPLPPPPPPSEPPPLPK